MAHGITPRGAVDRETSRVHGQLARSPLPECFTTTIRTAQRRCCRRVGSGAMAVAVTAKMTTATGCSGTTGRGSGATTKKIAAERNGSADSPRFRTWVRAPWSAPRRTSVTSWRYSGEGSLPPAVLSGQRRGGLRSSCFGRSDRWENAWPGVPALRDRDQVDSTGAVQPPAPTTRPVGSAHSLRKRRATAACIATPVARASSSTSKRGWWWPKVIPSASFRTPSR